MKVLELIQLLEDMPEEAEVRLAFQPNYPLQYNVGDVAIDEGHVHSVEFVVDPDAWYCADDDCDAEWDHEPLDHELGLKRSPDEVPGIVYIGEAGQIYDEPYLPGSAAQALGWGR